MNVAAMFHYLDELRESGETNMYGAGPYLREAFGVSRAESHRVLAAWMETFDAKKSPAERAQGAVTL